MTPQEAWSGYKPTVAHFKTFGCIAHVHLPNQRRSKLEGKSEKTIFVGYSEKAKSYKLYDPVAKKTIASRDVVFEENKSWENSSPDKSSSTHILDEPETSNEPTDNLEEDNISTPVQNPSNNQPPTNPNTPTSTSETASR